MQFVVGRVGRPHWVRGLVTVEVRTDDPGRRFAPGAVLVTDPADVGPLVVEGAKEHSGRLLLAFEGYPDRTAVEALRGVVLLTDDAGGGSGEDGSGQDGSGQDGSGEDGDEEDGWYDHELVGLRATLQDGTAVGTVVEVLHRAAQDGLVVERADGVRVEVPFVAAIVPVVDVEGGVVVLDPPGGLLDPESLD